MRKILDQLRMDKRAGFLALLALALLTQFSSGESAAMDTPASKSTAHSAAPALAVAAAAGPAAAIGAATGDSAQLAVAKENVMLRDSLARMMQQVAKSSVSGPKSTYHFKWAARIAFLGFVCWLLLVVMYYAWAIKRYTVNYGITDEEWKILHPEMYASDKEMAKYQERHAAMLKGMEQASDFSANASANAAASAGAANAANASAFGANAVATPAVAVAAPGANAGSLEYKIPDDNPYKGESFGLPPGTVRGTLALTVMVIVVLVEGVNLYSPTSLELHFSELLSVFKIVIAFYFGAKFLEGKDKPAAAAMVAKVTNAAAVDAATGSDAAGASGAGASNSGGTASSAIVVAGNGSASAAVASAPAAASGSLGAAVSSFAGSAPISNLAGSSDSMVSMAKKLELPAEQAAMKLGLTDLRLPNIQANLENLIAKITGHAKSGGTTSAPVTPALPSSPTAGAAPAAAPEATAPVAADGDDTADADAGAAQDPSASVGVASVSAPAVLTDDSPLKLKVLSLTSSFETGLRFPDCFGAVAGNFDGQGMSFGALQWNFGQDTLQPLFKKALQRDEAQCREALGEDLFTQLSEILEQPKDAQLDWVKKFQISKQNPATGVRRVVMDPAFLEPFHRFGKTGVMIDVQLDEVEMRFQKAVANCEIYGLTAQRGVALMFDINVQNGLVDKDGAGARIRQDIAALDATRPADELQTARMIIIAKRRCEVVNAQWRADVLQRKLTIANGMGNVHGKNYDLAADFKISLAAYA